MPPIVSGVKFDAALERAVVGRQARYGEHRNSSKVSYGYEMFFLRSPLNSSGQEARLSVSEVAVFANQVLPFFKSFTEISISA